jgi:DNA-binding NarL/FixJ family response regulator
MIPPKKVLIVDRSPIFRNALKDVIRISKDEVEIAEAPGASQALEIIRRDPPDVAFIDIALPEGDGFLLLERIRGMTPRTCVIVLTSNDSAEYREASIQKGAEYFLSKERSGGLRLLNVINQALR